MNTISSKNKRVFLISSYSIRDEKKIRRLIYELGGEVTELDDTLQATHLVVPFLRITHKLIAALAAGLWIVQTSYVLESHFLKRWILEAKYEIGSKQCPYSLLSENGYIPFQVKYEDAPRMCREKALVRNRPNLSDWKVGLYMECQSSLLQTKRILHAGGATISVLTLPVDRTVAETIDFAIVKVYDLSSVVPLMEIGIICVPYTYISDSLCMDPPPNISRYDCRHQGRREECLIKDSSGHESHISSRHEEILRTPLGIIDNGQRNAWNCCGKDNFKITLNSSGTFLMNTAISVTVDFNHQLMSEPEVKSIKNVSEIKTLSSSVKSSPRIPMGEYYSQDTFTLQRERSLSNRVEKLSPWDHPKVIDMNRSLSSQPSPAKKRVLSPRNGRSPSKKRKSFSPQTNKIFNYLVRTDGIKIENVEQCREVENHSFCDSADMNCRDNSRICSSNKIVKNTLGMGSSMNTDIPVIEISSDDDDSPVSISVKEVREKSSWQTHCSVMDICDQKPVVHVNTPNRQERNECDARNLSENLSGNSSRKNNECKINLVSSDEDDELWLSSQTVIDLTCDDLCSSDDAGGVIVPESKHFQKSFMEKVCENDEDDDDCISGISLQPGLLSQREKCIKNDSCTSSPEGKIKIENVTAYTNQYPKKEINVEKNKKERSVLSLHEPPCISHLETTSNLDDLCTKFAFMHPSEDNENISDILLNEADKVTSSNSPWPPHPCENLGNIHDKSVEGNGPSTLGKNSSEKDYYEIKENLEYEQQNVCKDNDDNFSAVAKDKSICGFNELISLSNEGKMFEKENVGEATSSEEVNKSFPKIICPSAIRVCQVQAEVLLSKFCQPWIDLDTDEVPKCCETGPAVCFSVHGKKELCPEESDFFDERLLWSMDNGSSAIDLIQSRLNVFVLPTTSVLQNLLYCCMDLWVEGVSEVMKWLRHLLKLHPPCAFGMLDYYRKVLFSPAENIKANEGTFWSCLTKIEEVINAIKKEDAERNVAPKTSGDQHKSSEFNRFLECAESPMPCEKEEHTIKHSDRLNHLFDTLNYLTRVMEADLNMGLVKNYSNLKRYTCKTGRPLIAVALWGTHGTVGNVNSKCRHLMKLYIRSVESYHDIEYHRYFRRLISLMAGVTYASERNTEPPRYPNIGSNCRDLANAFASIMMVPAMNMREVALILDSISPDWFRLCVCYNLIEKLYGRNMELSLQPTVTLLKSLNNLNQVYPSDEEIFGTLLAEPDTNKNPSRDTEELSPNYVKQALKKDKRGETRLHIACRRNNIQEVERLLNVPGININEKDNIGWTPLHEAAFHGSLDCVKCLLNFRTPSGGPAVDIEARSEGGVTPLMDAVSKNHLEVASVLLQFGGQKLLAHENSEGCSVWDLARTEEMKHILSNAQDCCQEYDLLTIPRTLYVKLAVLTPLAIKYYIKFSEVRRIIHYLKYHIELTRDGTSLVKFQPIDFKHDHLELKKLQSFLKEKLSNDGNNKLLNTLDSFV